MQYFEIIYIEFLFNDIAKIKSSKWIYRIINIHDVCIDLLSWIEIVKFHELSFIFHECIDLSNFIDIGLLCISVTNLFVNSLLVGGIWTLEIHRKYSFIFSEILFKRNSLDINFLLLLRHLSATIYLNRPIFLTWIFPQSWNDALSQLVSWKNSIFCQTIFNDFRKRN